MNTIDDWKKYLRSFRYEKGSGFPITHTSIDHPKTALHVPDAKLDDFMATYQRAIVSNIPLYMTEKPKSASPLRVDFDFRFVKPTTEPVTKKKTKSTAASEFSAAETESVAETVDPTDNSEHLEQSTEPLPLPRLYKKEHVKKFVTAYCRILSKYIDAPADAFKAYVMEKPEPSESNKKIKDGIHIVFPNMICGASFQHLVRHQVLSMSQELFEGVPVCNTYKDVVDEAIIERNNWQMYGSTKPGCHTYKVTQIYEWVPADDCAVQAPDIDVQDILNLPVYLSMRKEAPETPIYAEKKAEVDEFVRCVLPNMDDRRKSKLHGQIFGMSINKTKTQASPDELDLTKKLVSRCLKPERVDSYDDWIKLGWCLRNIDISLLDTWINFSKLSSKYIEGECQNLWDKMRSETFGIGTLRWWSRQDNSVEYDRIINDNMTCLIDRCVGTKGAHFDVARVVHAKYKDKYQHTVKDVWYFFDETKHRWVHTRDAIKLRTALSMEVCPKFLERANYWTMQSAVDPENKEKYDDKYKKLLKISEQLLNMAYNSSVMKACECLFTNEKFEQLLDSHPHLIGFENGVYDLRLHEFRDGMPDDYISFSTKQHYFPYNKNSQEAQEIDKFFKEVYTNDAVRKFTIDILSTVIDGSVKMEKFYVFTGSGSNSKSCLLSLMQKAIGEYYAIIPISYITNKRAASNQAAPELERTKGRRMAVLQEPGENEKLNIGIMKEVTGGDIIQCRGLFKEPIEFKPQFKMFLICNDLPEVPSDDGGTWRRIRVVEHTSKFCEFPDPSKPNEFPMDIELYEKLERWAPTFISMLIDHHDSIDPKKITDPIEVRNATDKYKRNNDIIAQYIDENISFVPNEPNERMSITTLWTSFRVWTSANITKGRKIPDRQQLKSYFENKLGAYPSGNKGWKGVKVKDDDVEDEDDVLAPLPPIPEPKKKSLAPKAAIAITEAPVIPEPSQLDQLDQPPVAPEPIDIMALPPQAALKKTLPKKKETL